MKNNMETFVKGMGMGVALGCTAGVVGTYLMTYHPFSHDRLYSVVGRA